MNILPDFQYIRPLTIDDAVAALAAAPTAVPVAGATDLLPNLRRGLGRPEALVDMSAIAGLNLIEETAQGWRIGAGVPLAELARHEALRAAVPVIAEAALAVAGPTHRAAGTLGGNLCQDTRCIFYNQSEWWRSGNDYCLKYEGDRCHVALKSKSCFATYRGDLAPALMVLGAEIELTGPHGRRVLPLAELFCNNGAQHLTLEPAEILTAVVVPKAAGNMTAGYAKIRIRDAIDFPLAGVAVAFSRKGDRLTQIQIAVTGIGSMPLMVATESFSGQVWDEETARQLINSVGKTAKAQNTMTVGTKYRRQVLLSATRRLMNDLWSQASPG